MNTGVETGDLVATPEGLIGRFAGYDSVRNTIFLDCTSEGATTVQGHLGDLVRLNSSIRVKVQDRWAAKSLVELAKKHGFSFTGNEPITTNDFNYHNIRFDHANEDHGGKVYYLWTRDCDFTYRQHLQRIEIWLRYHDKFGGDEATSKAEGKCETCGGGEWISPDGLGVAPCPNCTDESEDYSEEELQPPQYPTQEAMDNTPNEVKRYINELEQNIDRQVRLIRDLRNNLQN